ncbi:MAG: MBL fold metallo-hydrolase RNA specificity domain-containing protein, partial [Verrucomicrobiota bacterium]
ERKAEVAVLNAFSGHADRNDLLNYARKVKAKQTFLVHGDDTPRKTLAQALRDENLGEVHLPKRGDVVEI